MIWMTDGNFSSLTRMSEWKQHLHGLQQQFRAVPESLQGIQNHNVILVLHKLHQVVITH